jgi:hypothetical protein
MRVVFRKKTLAILGLLAFGLSGIALLAIACKQESIEAQIAKQRLDAQKYAAEITPLLTYDEAVVGEWQGVRSSSALEHSRRFAKTGKMFVCYGDVIIDGSYRLIDKTTLETRNRFSGEINRWTFGFLKGELILINQQTSWVEEYKRVAPGTLRGPLLE